MEGNDTSTVKDGFYRQYLNNTEWIIPKRYQMLQVVGTGAYGQVCSAYDAQNGRKVAIKKMSRPFQNELYAKRTFRELKILSSMHHENIISLLDVFTDASSLSEFKEVYLVMTYMQYDLHYIIKNQFLTENHIRLHIYQILRAVMYMHSAGAIHRDLKPSNIALSEDNEVKIIDFGLSRPVGESMSGYVVTRWYRAPEVVLEWMGYGQSADIWSVGAIMGEMAVGEVIFRGKDTIDQLSKIIEIIGKPSEEFINKLTSASAKAYLCSMCNVERKPFRKVFAGLSDEGVDLLERMLEIDPEKRITARNALRHPFFSLYHDPEDEPVSTEHVFDYGDVNFEAETWRGMTYDEILTFQENATTVDTST